MLSGVIMVSVVMLNVIAPGIEQSQGASNTIFKSPSTIHSIASRSLFNINTVIKLHIIITYSALALRTYTKCTTPKKIPKYDKIMTVKVVTVKKSCDYR